MRHNPMPSGATATIAALALASSVAAAPISFFNDSRTGTTTRAGSASVGADVQLAESTPHATGDSPPSRFEAINPRRWFSKWLGGSHQESTPQFTQDSPNNAQAFAYQAPTKPVARVALAPSGAKPVDIPSLPPREEASPEATRAAIELSQSLEASGQVDNARSQLVDHLTTYSYDVRALRALGHLEDRAGNLAQAEMHYRQALGADSQSASALNDLGLCLARQGRMEESHAALLDAIRLAPDKALYRNNVATILVELARDDQALAQLQAVYPPATAGYNLGQLQARSGRTDEAVSSFRDALAIDPTHAAAANALARLAPESSDQPEWDTTGTTPITPIEEPTVAAEITPEGGPTEVAAAPSFPRLLPPALDR